MTNTNHRRRNECVKHLLEELAIYEEVILILKHSPHGKQTHREKQAECEDRSKKPRRSETLCEKRQPLRENVREERKTTGFWVEN